VFLLFIDIFSGILGGEHQKIYWSRGYNPHRHWNAATICEGTNIL